MNRLSLYLLFFCLPLTASLCGQSTTESLDLILASPADTHQVRALIKLADSLSHSMMKIPDTLFERGIELAEELNDDRGLADLYTERFVYCLNGREMQKGMEYVAQAIKYARASGQNDLLRYASTSEVIFLMVGGRTEEAAERASVLVKEFHASGDLIGESEAYGILSSLSSGFGNYELAIAYDSSAIDRALRSESLETIERAYLTASISRSQFGDSETGLELAEKAIAVSRERGSAAGERNGLSARAAANLELGNYAEALADYEILKVGQGARKSTWRMTNMGILLQRIGRHEEARAILLEVVRMVKATSNDPVDLINSYRGLQTVGLNQTAYDTVVWYGKLMKAEQDSLQSAKNIKNLLELEEKYKAEEKEVEILLQQEQLSRQRVQLYGTILGLLLALGGGISFFLLSQRLKKRNTENEQLLTDKETLIGEIHHRVKNNLQVVSSLLQLQRRGLESDDDKGYEALLESQSRVNAMGLIHQKLYQGEEVTSVYLPEYLEDLGETLINAYRLEEQVEIFYDVEDINLDVDNVIPLGLIVNELITNSMKYAFPNGREGTIEIAVYREEGLLRLSVLDNGVGAAAEKRSDSTSFGSNLIGLLTQKLKGKLKILEGQGYGVEILFEE